MRLISCTILLLVIISCNNAEKEYLDKDGFEVIAISNAKKTREIGLSPYIDYINYIPLETGPNILVGGVKKIEIGPQYIYVLDRRNSNTLSVFDHQGNFYTRIGQAGKGPGEYCSAHDFCLLGGDSLVLYDRDCKRLLYYHNLKFVKSVKIGWYAHSLATQNGHFYFYMQKQYFPNPLYQGNYDLITTNSSLGFVNKSFNFSSDNKMSYDPRNVFSLSNSNINFIRRFSNKVYRITDNKVSPRYFLDFSPDIVPFEKTKSFEAFNQVKDNYSFLWEVFIETPRFVYFDASMKGDGYVHHFIYDKINYNLIRSKRIDNDLDGVYCNFISSNDTCLIGVVDPIEILGQDKGDKSHLPSSLQKVGILDNPVIAIYKLKTK